MTGARLRLEMMMPRQEIALVRLTEVGMVVLVVVGVYTQLRLGSGHTTARLAASGCWLGCFISPSLTLNTAQYCVI